MKQNKKKVIADLTDINKIEKQKQNKKKTRINEKKHEGKMT